MTLYDSLAPGALLGGKFRIDHLIGAGAMGAVYAIDHELTRHKRALKLLHPEVQHVPDLVRRFLNEASAAGRAGNPHLVETFDAGTLPTGEPYVVMELLSGETLSARLEREQRLEPSLAAELVAQAAEGMEAAHRAGIIHRDLKPDNLFITEREGSPFIKILDFGVSKFATASAAGVLATQAGAVYGTPSYMAPEQIGSSVELDARADVFALGVVLFECLSGTLPFEAPSIPALALKLVQGESASLAALRPELQPELVEVVQRALAADRERRIPSACALAEALAPFRIAPCQAASASPDFAPTLASVPAARPPRSAFLPALLSVLLLALGAGLWRVHSRFAASLPATSGPPRAAAIAAPNSARGFAQGAPVAATLGDAAFPLTPRSPVAAPLAERPREVVSGLRVESAPPSSTARARRTASSLAPAATPEARSRPAQDLRLREDNPFR